MKPKVTTACFSLLLWSLYLVSSSSYVKSELIDGQCLDQAALSIFTSSPGEYDPKSGVDGQICARLCADSFFPYAGIIDQQYCLCAPDEAQQSLELVDKVDERRCQHEKGFVRVFKGHVIGLVNSILVDVKPELAYIDDTVLIEIQTDVPANGDILYQVDFGDGSDPIEWTEEHIHRHSYRFPGKHKITVQAHQPLRRSKKTLTAGRVVQIIEPLTASDIEFQCTPLIEPTEDPQCNATINSGQNLFGKLNFDNGEGLIQFNISDIRSSRIGTTSLKGGNFVTNYAHGGNPIIISDFLHSITRTSTVRAVEGFGRVAGAIELVIYRANCETENDECPTVEPSLEPCPPNSVFCLKNERCVRKSNRNESCTSLEPNFFPEYKRVRRVRLTVNKGPFFIRLSKPRMVKPGDIVAFQSFGGLVEARPVESKEKSDIILDKLPTDEVPPRVLLSNKLKHNLGLKHLFAIFTNEAITLTFPRQLNESRLYNVRLAIGSKWMDTEFPNEQLVNVEKSIGKIKMRVAPPNTAVGRKVDVTLNLQEGTNVKLHWNFGDGTQEEETIEKVEPGQKAVKTHTYTEPGVYEIVVNAQNIQNDVNVTHTLIAQHAVNDDWELRVSSPGLLPDKVNFTMSYPPSTPLPTNATVDISFGDGQTTSWPLPSDKLELKFEHPYKYSGRYKVVVTITNLISSTTLKKDVYLLRRIEGFAVDYGMSTSESKNGLEHGFGPNKDVYPMSSDVQFQFRTTVGDVEKYIILLNNQSLKEVTDKSFTYSPTEIGWHNFTLMAYNDIQKETSPVNVSLYYAHPVSELKLTELTNNILVPEEKHFQISFQNPGTHSCLLLNFGDLEDIPHSAYGDIKTCNLIFPSPKYRFDYLGNLSNPLNVSYTFSGPGDYQISAYAGNLVPPLLTTTLSTTVIEIDCKPPEVEIKNPAEDYFNATEVWRSKAIQLYAKTGVDCNATVTVIKKWEAFLLDPETGSTLESVDLSSLDSYQKTVLYVPPFFMKAGIYRFRFSLNITGDPSHPLLPLYEQAETHVLVVPSPIIGRMIDGSQSRIVRGWGQRLVLSPGTSSLDPDEFENKNFNVTWFCRRASGEKIDRSLADSDQIVTKPILDRKMVEGKSDLGGCFGDGPGLIQLQGGMVEWNTTVFFKPGLTYEVVVRLDPPDRAPSWAGIQIVVLERNPPSIQVQCQTAPLCYPNVPVGQKINPVRVGLIGLCSEDCEGELTYEWSVQGVKRGNEIALKDAKDYMVGSGEEKMALSKEFFDRYYPEFGDFIVKLAVVNDKGDKGESDIFLHINQPPTGGECLITSDGDLALVDKHHVSCSGWFDPEGKPVEYYAFWIRNPETGVISYLMYGPDRDASLVLPFGLFTIGIDIKDKEGSLTRLNITHIQTKAPTKQQFESFMSTKPLENCDASGDQAMMNMVSQALSSLMNINLVDENEPEAVIVETTTAGVIIVMSNRTKSEEEIAEDARTKAKMVQSVESLMNMDTLNSLEQIGSVLTSIAGKGKGVDNTAKETVIKLLNKTVSLASTIQVESPQQLLDFCMFAVGTMGGIVNRMTEQIVEGVVLPTDRAKAWDLEYSVEAPEFGEEQDYIFDGKSSVEESLAKAVVEHERKAGEAQIKQMIKLTIDLVLSMLRTVVVGEEPLEFSAPSGLSLTISMFSGGGLSNKSIQHGDAIYVFPPVCSILAKKDPCYGNETLGVMAVSWPAILESYGNSVDLLSANTKTLQLMLLDENLNILDVSDTKELFSIIVPRKVADGEKKSGTDSELSTEANEDIETNLVEPEMKWYENMVYHQFLVEKSESAVTMQITPTNPEADLLLFICHRFKPMINRYEILIPLKAMSDYLINGTYELFLGNHIIQNRTGFFYLGVAEVNRTELMKAGPEFSYILDEMIINPNVSSYNLTEASQGNLDTSSGGDLSSNQTLTNGETLPGLIRNFTTNYHLSIFTSGCYFFNYKKGIWSGEGCYVKAATKALTHCKCNHLTSFGSGFFVMPNTVDFTYVFANAGFADNVTIYMTIILSLLAYVLLLLWARREDRKDLEKLGATPLEDNNPKDKYLYEITVFTGDRDGAGTDSLVSFILSGDDDETDVRVFSDPKRKIFRRGAQDSFVMATPNRLGRLNYCRIWHDNSGKGKFRSWFLSFIVVRDIQTGEKFEFICNRWLAVEKDDGSIDRLLPVAGREEATQFSHLFHQTTQKNLKDGHLWFSIFMRPPRSRFTRVQRVSCCMALLYLSMLVNAMWYQRVPPKPKSSAMEIGPFALSPEQIGVGFLSNLIVFPPTFLIVLLFRKSRLRKLRPSRIKEALERQASSSGNSRANSGTSNRKMNKMGSTMNSTSSLTPLELSGPKEFLGINNGKGANGHGLSKPIVYRKKKSAKLLPWWCRYIGWSLCILSMLVSIFFLWAYGIQFGDEKTRKWVTSLIVSFFTSILVTQPVKVLLTAIILSTIFKSPDSEVDDSEEDEEEPDLELSPDEEWLHTLTEFTPKKRNRAKLYRPPDLTALEKAKLERLKEIKMTAILKDIWSYLIFLWILIVLSYGNRDPNAFLMKTNLHNIFIDGANTKVSFTDVKSTEDLWSWIVNGLNKDLRVGSWYNGRQAYGLRGFINDRTSRMMGYGVLRQVRIKEKTCQVNPEMEKLLPEEESKCRSFSKMVNEDRRNYAPGWKSLGGNHSYIEEEPEVDEESGPVEKGVLKALPGDPDIVLVNPSKSKKTEWEYRRTSELDGLPFWGKLDVYSGGGYVLPLKGTEQELTKKVEKLKKLGWIDERTRAVFAEFSVYNPQVNLFGVITIVGEFLPGGGVVPTYRIDVVRLIHHHQGFGLFVVLCELSFVAFIVYFTIREFKNWRKQGACYFKSYWNMAEIILIGFSYVAIGLYFYRFALTYKILKIFDATHGNAYIKLQYVAQIDEIFGYIVAFSIFIGILKFIRLLRFNKRMGILYSTLNQCSKDLKSFCIVFLIVFFAFVQMFNLLFGLHMSDFSSLVNAAETTFGMATGKFNFDAMCRASPVLGPLSFFIFILVAQMVLINVFLTLIISAFETVKHDIGKQSNEFEIVNFMVKKTKEMLGIYDASAEKQKAALTAMARVEGVSTIEDQLNCFPEKVDRLLQYINSVYITTTPNETSGSTDYIGGSKTDIPLSIFGASGRKKPSISTLSTTNYRHLTEDLAVAGKPLPTTLDMYSESIQKRRTPSGKLIRQVSAVGGHRRGRRSIDSNGGSMPALNGRRLSVPRTSVFDWIELGEDEKLE